LLVEAYNHCLSQAEKAGEYITQVTALGPPGLEFSMPPAIRANEAREIHDARAIGRGNRQS
jgi:hypothetical protein